MGSSQLKALRDWLTLVGLLTVFLLGATPDAVAACGGAGQSACKIWERIPSCDAGLMEVGGRCEACGAEGQRACPVTVRVPSCNTGLIEDFSNNRCKLKAVASREPVLGVDCGAKDGVDLPCWADFKDDDEGNESLPYYPYAKRANGCTIPGGPPGSQDDFTSFGNTFSFTQPCNNHDVCYYTLGSNATTCNKAFYDDLTSACSRPLSLSADAVSRELAKHECLTRRDGMTAAVTAGQGKFHSEAQATQHRYQDRVAEYLSNHTTAAGLPAGAFSGTLKASHSSKCLDGTSPDNGSNVHQWDCHGGANQALTFTPVDGKASVYTLRFKHSNRCLDGTTDTGNGTNLYQWDCHGLAHQQFRIDPVGDGLHRLTAEHSGRVVDVSSNSNGNGDNIHQWEWWNGGNQKWLIIVELNPS